MTKSVGNESAAMYCNEITSFHVLFLRHVYKNKSIAVFIIFLQVIICILLEYNDFSKHFHSYCVLITSQYSFHTIVHNTTSKYVKL